MTFLLSEDEALRNLLVGMTVTDQKSSSGAGPARSVKVYFGQPDQELRDQTYPYITIDMIDIAEDTSRAMRGLAKPSYLSNPINIELMANAETKIEEAKEKVKRLQPAH